MVLKKYSSVHPTVSLFPREGFSQESPPKDGTSSSKWRESLAGVGLRWLVQGHRHSDPFLLLHSLAHVEGSWLHKGIGPPLFFLLCPALSSHGLYIRGISQAGTLAWVAISSSRESSWPRDGTHVSCIAGGFFTAQPPGKPFSYSFVLLLMLLPCIHAKCSQAAEKASYSEAMRFSLTGLNCWINAGSPRDQIPAEQEEKKPSTPTETNS